MKKYNVTITTPEGGFLDLNISASIVDEIALATDKAQYVVDLIHPRLANLIERIERKEGGVEIEPLPGAKS